MRGGRGEATTRGGGRIEHSALGPESSLDAPSLDAPSLDARSARAKGSSARGRVVESATRAASRESRHPVLSRRVWSLLCAQEQQAQLAKLREKRESKRQQIGDDAQAQLRQYTSLAEEERRLIESLENWGAHTPRGTAHLPPP